MDTLQKQVTNLNSKVDALSQAIEQVNIKLSELASELHRNPGSGSLYSQQIGTGHSLGQTQSAFDMVMEHKDVLADSNSMESTIPGTERELAPEIQIRRLTAQLTAAYNRIAALEEQLLAQRIH